VLEIIKEKAKGQPKGSIVFIHGAWHGAWCWQDNFLPYFAEQGYDCYAPSLRGHGKSESNKNLKWLKISDYAEDVLSVVKDLEGDVYIMGHSMGGYVVQKFLEDNGHLIKKGILIASVPSNGAKIKPLEIIKAIGFSSFLKMNLMLDLVYCVNTIQKVRNIFFNPDTPVNIVNATASKVQGESFFAYLGMLNKWLIKPKKITTPLLIVSAGNDWFFPPDEQAELVKTYKAPQNMYPDAPHNLFATEGWQKVAADIQVFLEK
jgi:pimeloyl-ACP methyl ester carboxylesterase